MMMKILAGIGTATIICCFAVIYTAILIYIGDKFDKRDDED